MTVPDPWYGHIVSYINAYGKTPAATAPEILKSEMLTDDAKPSNSNIPARFAQST